MGEACGRGGTPEAETQGLNTQPHHDGDITAKIPKMNQLACFGAIGPSNRNNMICVGELNSLWKKLRDDLFCALARGATAETAQTSPSGPNRFLPPPLRYRGRSLRIECGRPFSTETSRALRQCLRGSNPSYRSAPEL